MKNLIKFIGKSLLGGMFFCVGVILVYAASTLINSVTTQTINKGDQIGSGWFQEVNDKIISLINGKTNFQTTISGNVEQNSSDIAKLSGDLNQILSIGSQYNPGLSCKNILDTNPATVGEDGKYWIDPDGSGGESAFEVYCDMTTDGGGWTLVDNDATDSDTFSDRSLGANPDINTTKGSYLPGYKWSSNPQLMVKSSYYDGSKGWVILNAESQYALEYPIETTLTNDHGGDWSIEELNGNTNQGTRSRIYNGDGRFGSVWIGEGSYPTVACNYGSSQTSGLGDNVDSSNSTCSTWVR